MPCRGEAHQQLPQRALDSNVDKLDHIEPLRVAETQLDTTQNAKSNSGDGEIAVVERKAICRRSSDGIVASTYRAHVPALSATRCRRASSP